MTFIRIQKTVTVKIDYESHLCHTERSLYVFYGIIINNMYIFLVFYDLSNHRGRVLPIEHAFSVVERGINQGGIKQTIIKL